MKVLNINEGDEVEFIDLNSNAFILSKKSDILGLIMQDKGLAKPAQEPQGNDSPSAKELSVLKKIDTLRYNERTSENVSKLLNAQEKETLSQMVRKNYLKPFKSKQGIEVYSISKNIYDNFLMRKPPARSNPKRPEQQESAPREDHIEYLVKSKAPEDEYIKELGRNGFIVLLSEGEASRVSMLLEQSIRTGEILGTRAFNKKFYIVLREYLNRYTPSIIKALRAESAKAEDIAKKSEMQAEGARAILYILAESGEITEKRKDLFAIA